MQLCHHPLLSYLGLHSWPPIWTPVHETDNARPKGEVGILKEIHLSPAPPGNAARRLSNRIFLFTEHGGEAYVGCLLIDDYDFCEQLAGILRRQYGRSIQEIGAIDMGGTL